MTDRPIMTQRLAALPPGPVGIQRLAYAISVAEGFWVKGSVPNRANNPLDLKVLGWTGPVIGAENIPCFLTVIEGWQRGYTQLQRIVNGASSEYTLAMSIEQMAERWTDTADSEWGNNVALVLDLPITTTLRTLLTPDVVH